MGFKETCQGFPPARFVMAFMAFTGYINVYIVRNNINLAIVAMVNYTAIREEVNPSNDSLIPEEKQCEFQTVNSTDTSEDGPFPWSEPIQALISTSFLWGYFITNIPGGRLAEIFGTKYLLAISQILASALTMLIPIAASVGWELIIVIRVTMGLVQGPSFPCMHPLLAKWIPPQERGTISAVIYAGQQLGTVVGLLLTGLIINKLGWEAVFYIEGCIGFVWTFFWLLLVFDSPDTHPRISKAEKKYIRTSIANDASPTKKVASVPWKDIFTSLPFYAILIANIGHNWGFLILLTELPIYMKNILGFDIKSNSMATAFPYFLTWLASIAVSPLADLCKQKEWLSTVWIRKIFTLIGHMGPAVCLTAVAFAGCDLTLILVMLTLSVSLQAGIYAGWFINHIDIASNFAGTLFGLTNGLSIIPSWIGPLVVGFITKGNQTTEAWQIVFLLAAVVLGFDAVFFLIFASGDEQPWNKEATKQTKKEDTRESMKCFDAGTTDTKSEAQKTAQKDLKCPSTS